MKNLFAIIFAVCLSFLYVGYSSARSVETPTELDIFAEEEALNWDEGRADRHRRVTCDLLSPSVLGFQVNHGACAAHCLVLGNGYRGGRCINGVCHCRR